MPNLKGNLISFVALWIMSTWALASNIDLGAAKPYNLYSLGEVTASNSIVEGAATSGSTIQLKASQSNLPTNPAVLTAEPQLKQLSQSLAAYPNTGKTSAQKKVLTLEGDCTSKLQVFTVNANEMVKANGLNLRCIPESASVVINLVGIAVEINSLSCDSFAAQADKVLFNAASAQTINIKDADFQGSLLAPAAQVSIQGGSFSGQLIAKGFSGATKLFNVPFQKESLTNSSDQPTNIVAATSPNSTNKAPDCSKAVASPSSLWPVNHKFQKISIKGVSDPNNDALDIRVQCIFQDEPLNSLGDGNTEYDAQGIDTSAASVRAERSGTSDGRVYHIEFKATDPLGESCRGEVKVAVPHSSNGTAFDGGKRYQSVKSPFDCQGIIENHAPNITSTPPTTATANQAYRYQVIASDQDGDTLTYEFSTSALNDRNAPAGMTIDSLSGVIEWIPSKEQVGTTTVDVIVKDGRGGSDSQSFTITVAAQPNRNPIITSIPATSIVEKDVYTYKIIATDPDDDILTLSLVNAPAQMKLDTATQQLFWATYLGDAGIYPVTVRADDGSGGVAEQSFNLTVTPLNQAPVIISVPIATGIENALYTYQVQATDLNNDKLIYAIENAPEGMSIDQATGLVQWTPSFTQSGEYQITVTVSDTANAVDKQTYTLTISNANRAPVFTSSPVTEAKENASYTYKASAFDEDGDSLRFGFAGDLPSGMTLDPATGVLTWIPSFTQSGQPSVTLTVTDGQAITTQTFSIFVANTNQIPVASTQHITTKEDTESAIVLHGDDADGDSLTYILVTQPLHGKLVGNVPNLTYLPETNYNGEDSFRFQVSDSIDTSSTASITLSITPVNDAPMAKNVNASGVAGSKIALTLVGEDVEGSALTYDIVTPPAHGTITGTPPNLNYVANNDFSGDEIFKYSVSDGELSSPPAIVTIKISKFNVAPVITSTPITVAPEKTLLTQIVEAMDPNNDDLLFKLAISPEGMSLDASTGLLSWLPPNSFVQTVPQTNKQCYISGESPVYIQGTGTTVPGDIRKLPDLRIGAFKITGVDEQQVEVSVEVQNRGLASALGKINVDVFNGPIAINDKLATAELTEIKEGSTVAITFKTQKTRLTKNIYAQLKTDNSVEECDVSNNKSQAALVKVIASDPQLLTDEQWFFVNVEDVNQPPTITSQPPAVLQEGQAFSYKVTPADGDIGDAQKFTLLQGPEGLLLDPRSGEFTSVPGTVQPGTYVITVEVEDLRGGTSQQTFTLNVTQNLPPKIISTPSTTGKDTATYVYDILAQDPNLGDIIRYSVEKSPIGTILDSQSGHLTWANTSKYTDPLTSINSFCYAEAPSDTGNFDPVLKWQWNRSDIEPTYNQAMSAPVVAQLNDDNGDGVINNKDIADIVIVTYEIAHAPGDGIIRALNGRDGSEIFVANAPNARVNNWSNLAVADLDGDHVPEIVGSRYGGGLVALDNKGSVKWINSDSRLNYGWGIGAPTIADLDGDGSPEILFGKGVVTASGLTKWIGSGEFFGDNHAGSWISPISIAADILPNTGMEVIAGSSVYSAKGELLWINRSVGDGLTAVADLNGDKKPEIVVVSNGYVAALNADGSAMWGPVALPGGGPGGAPTIGDTNGDGIPEIGVAGGSNYVVFNANGTIRWKQPTIDASSGTTGSTMIDFEGDGKTEILYADEYNFFVFDANTGTIRFKLPNSSGTAYEYPVVANVDSTPDAELILVSNDFLKYYGVNGPFQNGVRVFKSATGKWAPTRALWNQHAYHVDNINDDLSVPASPQKSWLTHNTYRLNRFPTHDALALPDLTVYGIGFNAATGVVTAKVKNRGLVPIDAPIKVKFFHENLSLGDQLIGEKTISSLDQGQEITISQPATSIAVDQSIRVEVSAPQEINECDQGNNLSRAAMFDVRAYDPAGLFDSQRFAVTLDNENQAPEITSPSTSQGTEGQSYAFSVQVTDPDRGDAFQFSLKDAPSGLAISKYTGRLSSKSLAEGIYTFTIKATDLGGKTAEQVHVLSVGAPDNHSPIIDSQPVVTSTVGKGYQYQLNATDADNDPLAYALSIKPNGMVINGETGLITWTPQTDNIGVTPVEVTVVDARGASAKQYYLLDVAEIEYSANHAPVITSVPSGAAYAGKRWVYQIVANDPDYDPLSYKVLTSASGMDIDKNGLLTWLPSAESIGQSEFAEITVSDDKGAKAVQKLTLPVNESANHPPIITSTPNLLANAMAAYTYAIEASDEDGDSFSFSLIDAPNGMQLQGQTLIWTPSVLQQAQAYNVSIKVQDERGAASTQTFDVSVNAPAPINNAPVIFSTPLTAIRVGNLYRYDVIARDQDGDPLKYQLDSAPASMTISTIGQINWTPTSSDIGSASISIRVSDGKSFVAQRYTIQVVDTGDLNHYPEITSQPFGQGVVGQKYTYQLVATDADGDALTYGAMDMPANMSVSPQGLVNWTPGTDQTGIHDVVLYADDGKGKTLQSYSISVSKDPLPLSAIVIVNPPIANAGDTVSIDIYQRGGSGPVTTTMTIDGKPVPTGVYGETYITAGEIGVHNIVIDLFDGSNHVTETASYNVKDPNDTAAPNVHIESPSNDAVITSPADVIATIEDQHLASYRLLVAAIGQKDYSEIAHGNSAVSNAPIAQFDPTTLNNGLYQIVLEATDVNGQISRDNVVVMVDGDMKVGNFALTFEDLKVDLAGIPLRVTRTYDTRQRGEALDFGHGWSVDYQNARVQESRTLGFSWSLNYYRNGFFGQYCVEPNGNPIVTVRLPDGSLEKFHAHADPACSYLVPTIDVHIVFDPQPGTYSTLEQNSLGLVRLSNGNIVDVDAGSLYDPNAYTLTTREGYIYHLDQSFGISKIEEPGGESITYSSAGITHSKGYQVKFERDANDRITALVLPDGRRIEYTYSDGGDLASVKDLTGAVTTFGYMDRMPHYLQEITDPRGVTATRMEYDDQGRLIAIIDAEGHRIEYTHDIVGKTESVRDRNGNISYYTYDDRGHVVGETNALGETTTRTYNDVGDVLTETNGLGETTTYTYSDRGFRTSETNAMGETHRYTYTDNGWVLTEVDPMGRPAITNTYDMRAMKLNSTTNAMGESTGFSWDSKFGQCGTGASRGYEDALHHTHTIQPNCIGPFAHLPYWEVDVNGTRTEYDYDNNGNKTVETTQRTDDKGAIVTLTTRFGYDSKGRVTSTTHPDGSVTRVEYNDIDKVTAEIDAEGRRTEHDYDDRGNETEVRYPDGSSESKTYDPNGNVETETDRLGRVTRYVYDVANRLTETQFADGSKTSSEYDAAGRLKASIDARGNRTEFVYDAAGRRIREINALANTTQYEYNAAGERTAVIDARGHRTEYIHDAAGRVIETRFADGTHKLTGYDALGRKVSDTDENGRVTRFDYDPLGHLTAVTDALGQVTRYSYDEQGNKVTQTDAKGRTTRWAYDNQGHALTRTLPLGQQESYTYDRLGRVASHTDFNGLNTIYTYDSADRVLTIDYADSNQDSFTYDANGNRLSATDANGTTRYEYDAANRLIRESQPSGAVLSYRYDAAGNRTELKLVVGGKTTVTTFGYDELNRLMEVNDPAAGITRYGYDSAGNRVTLDYPNGTHTQYGYDHRYHLTSLITTDTSANVLQGYTYTLDATGRRTRIDEANGRSSAYIYDTLYRLTNESATAPQTALYNASYTYDNVGNRVEQTVNGEVTPYSYDGNDRLVQQGGLVFTYDDNGNTLSDGKGYYTYNARNKLVNAITNDGEIAFTYNVDGIRTQKTMNGNTTRFVVDSNRDYAQVVLETGSGAQTAYTYGDDLISQQRGAAAHYYHVDGLGSTRLLSDSTGTATDSYAYSAFGEIQQENGTTTNAYRYTGEQFDNDLSQYYLRARYYDQGVGRFTQQDTWMGIDNNPITLNKYLYANDDPILNIDPTGNYTAPFGRDVERVVESYYMTDHPFDCVVFGKVATGSGSRKCADPEVLQQFNWPRAKPDILNHSIRKFNEIKPLSPNGIAEGEAQIIAYTAGLFPYTADKEWNPPELIYVESEPVYLINFKGVIFYTDRAEVAKQVAVARSFSNVNSALRKSSAISRIDGGAVIATGIGVAMAASSAYAVSQIATLVSNVSFAASFSRF